MALRKNGSARAAPPVHVARWLLIGLAWTFGVVSPSLASPISTTLEGCVAVTDPRLTNALWSAEGTFQAVAFDDELAGCGTTIKHPVIEPYWFDENRPANTLRAWLRLENLPTCGRRQYDLHYYLEGGLLDPMGLKSLVIDTGVDCDGDDPPPDDPPPLPEPPATWLWVCGLGLVLYRRMRTRA
jgi:hypothetical protein